MSATAVTGETGVQILGIGSERAGQRLDNFLLAQLKGAPRSLVYRIIRSGEVRVNGARSRPDRRLVENDRVRVPPIRLERHPVVSMPSRSLSDTLTARIVYEDEGLLVINKPSGLAVHGGSGVSLGLIEALRILRPDCGNLELVHRLDRDTSGCVMVAKKRSMLRHLHTALRDGTIAKVYLALVEGRWPKRRTRVTAALEKSLTPSGERVVRANESGKESETEFRILRNFGQATLVEARPITGRTHQIRVHAKVAGHPIAGDEKYGSRQFNQKMRESGIKRLFLHASEIGVSLPGIGPTVIQARLDSELANALENLER